MAGVQRFKLGDRVQLNTPHLGLPAQAQGTVVNVFLISGSYAVRFDATGQRLTVEQRYLEPVDKALGMP